MKVLASTLLGLFWLNGLFAQSILPVEFHRRLDSVFKLNNVTVYKDSNARNFYAKNACYEITISDILIADFMEKYQVKSDTFLVQGLLSHEYAHLKQQEKEMDLRSDSNFMFKELHADLLAGYYLSNLYRYDLMNNKTSDDDIVSKICLFFKSRDRNPNLYLIVSMLINGEYEYHYDRLLYKGNDKETVKILRFTAFWQGIRFSELQDIDDVYTKGLEYIQRLTTEKTMDKTFTTFQVIGLDIIDNILQSKYNYKESINKIFNRVKNSSSLPPEKRLETLLFLTVIKNKCS